MAFVNRAFRKKKNKPQQKTVEGLAKSLNNLFQKTGAKFSTDF